MSWMIVDDGPWSLSGEAPVSHGGGALFADGKANGRGTIARDGRVQSTQPISWRWIDEGRTIDICFTSEPTDGEPFLPPQFCLSTPSGFALPVGGVPVRLDLFGAEVSLRATQ
jgi:hypothetical protein